MSTFCLLLVNRYSRLFWQNLPAIFKIGIGLVKSVILIELAMRIRQGKKELRMKRELEDQEVAERRKSKDVIMESHLRSERRINVLRIVSLSLIIVILLLLGVFMAMYGLRV